MQYELESGLIGIRELAKRLAISRRSVWRIIERKELSVTRIGRRTLLSKTEIGRWLAGRQVAPPRQITTNIRRQFMPR